MFISPTLQWAIHSSSHHTLERLITVFHPSSASVCNSHARHCPRHVRSHAHPPYYGGERLYPHVRGIEETGEYILSEVPIQCWDNSTRGLDSANVLEFVKTLRLGAESGGCTSFVAIYQCSQNAYDVCPAPSPFHSRLVDGLRIDF